jgi:predicted phage terminase large subunit-like protein
MIITGIEKDSDLAIEKAKLLGSLLYFIRTFYKAHTGRDFRVSQPIGRESHHISICRQLTRIFHLESTRLVINVPPGHGKSTMLVYFIAWAWAHYPDCNFLYVSYSHDEASRNTSEVRGIISHPMYRKFFGVEVSADSSAKDDFKTNHGGTLKAYGSAGAVTGKNAGFPGSDRFSGGLIMDDMHKPDEVFSDNMRIGIINNYKQTMAPRVRGPKVPQIFLGQCLHEDDIAAFFKRAGDGHVWDQVVLKGIDDAGNVLDPAIRTFAAYKLMEKHSEYEFCAQYQQNPQPAGGGIFKKDDFVLLDDDPDFFATFITADTAETDKTYNDATVFSFWGLYKLNSHSGDTVDDFALHCIDCNQLRVEPKHLQSEFLSFYSECNMHKSRPQFVAIEKKSTGVTLLSCLSDMRGLSVRDIDRSRVSGSKTARFMNIQPYVAKKLISLKRGAKHTEMFIEHMGKITANDSHRHDDIADTLYDAVKIGLIDKTVQNQYVPRGTNNLALKSIMEHQLSISTARSNQWQR